MPTWFELHKTFDELPDLDSKEFWVYDTLTNALQEVSRLRSADGDQRNVIFYSSAFLQDKYSTEIHLVDVNGFVSVVNGMNRSSGLSLILHTPGGSVNAAEALVEFLRSEFEDIEVLVPALAMSAGTMISLSADRVVMGRQSQLGPIDPQFNVHGSIYSATSIVDTFEEAKLETQKNPNFRHVWTPVLNEMGFTSLIDARKAISLSETLVTNWLRTGMFKDDPQGEDKSTRVAQYFNDASVHLSHGRRIGFQEVKDQGIKCELLEDDPQLSEAVMLAYNIVTVLFYVGPTTKLIACNTGNRWRLPMGT